MTRIRMDWKKLALTAEGHAGGGPRGQNIICAGISALTQALLNQLLLEEETRTIYTIDEEKGTLSVRTFPDERIKPRILDYFRVIMTGLKAWEQAFPENVKTEEVNEDGTA